MRTRLAPFSLALALALCLATGCQGEPRVMRVEIMVEGMTCQSCVEAIKHELGRLEGVRSVEVDLQGGRTIVTFTEGRIEGAELEHTIESIGYEAELGTAQPLPNSD